MSSLLPERFIAFSPSLAATLGLEEAVLLQGLQEISVHAQTTLSDGPLQWQHAEQQRLRQLFPFWADTDVQRVAQSLVEKGVLLLNSAPYIEVKHLYFALNDGGSASQLTSPAAARQPVPQSVPAPAARKAPATAAPANAGQRPHKQPLPRDWTPDPDSLAQISQHGIAAGFVAQCQAEFSSYWHQRGDTRYAWGNEFVKRVVSEWRRQQARQNGAQPMQSLWRPDTEAMEILQVYKEIDPQFIEESIPEFVLYWRERGDSVNTWNSKFIAHVDKQWRRYNATLECDSELRLLPAGWQPREDVFDIVRMANIDGAFARALVPEFNLYWQERREMHSSWNTKFLQHVKYCWARQHQFDSGTSRDPHAQQQQSDHRGAGQPAAKTSAFERLTDRSWANDL